MLSRILALALLVPLAAVACGRSADHYDVLITGGTIYDGSGLPGHRASVALNGDRIVAVGPLDDASADLVLDASGLAVSPGFINMLSWSTESLIEDGRSLGEILQGVTTEVMGEGTSMGPLTPEMKTRWKALQGDVRFDYAWDSLAGYLQFLEHKGISPNVASFIGAGTIREYVIGHDNRPPTPEELDRMRALVRDEMEAGALGIGSSLIYAPDNFASTEELVALCTVAARHGGTYITHMRSEGGRLLEAVEEVIRISREAGIASEIYHLKAAGESNWPKMDRVIAMVEAARAKGLAITANMYVYTAGATGLNAALPPWALEGGYDALFARLAEPVERARIRQAMIAPATDWESLYQAAGSPERVLLVEFKSETLKPYTGKTLAEVSAMRGTDPYDTILDLMREDRTRVGAVYFLMSEDNVRKQIALPWVSFGSDGASMAPEGAFLRSSTHPRAYGNFAKLLGTYVRNEAIIPLEEAIRRLTSLPADNLHLTDRGRLRPGAFADVVIFDPATFADRATFEMPHQLAVGVKHVFVNGGHVVKDGEHTGATPGRALWGRGKK